jgi:hypothetical protein
MKVQRLALPFALLGLPLSIGLLLHERAAGAQSVPAIVRARAIELVDGRGRVRAQLDVESNGEVVFRLRDANGTIRVKLGASEAGSGLLLANEVGLCPTRRPAKSDFVRHTGIHAPGPLIGTGRRDGCPAPTERRPHRGSTSGTGRCR